jgi:hypothetical protein
MKRMRSWISTETTEFFSLLNILKTEEKIWRSTARKKQHSKKVVA